MVLADGSEADGTFGLYRVSIDTREKRQLTSPPKAARRDLSPAVSPDGRQLAFVRIYGAREASVLAQDLTEAYEPDGEPRKLSGDELASSPAWSADGTEIIYTSGLPRERPELRRVPGHGGESEPIAFASGGGEAAVSPTGERMVYVLRVSDDNVWQGSLTSGSEPQPLIRSTYRDLTPQYSPDGRRIAFSSNRSGHREIWVCDRDGRNAIQLTYLESIQSSGPNWSPNGQEIAFQSSVESQREIFVVPTNGGKPRQLTDHPAVDTEPTWSRDGAWIYFGSDRGGRRQIWKAPREGGEATIVTDGTHGLESHDGHDLYFFRRVSAASDRSVWRVPAKGGQAVKVVDRVHVQPLNTAITPEGLLYLRPSREPDGNWWLWRYGFESGKEERVFPLPGRAGVGVAASPDGDTVLFTVRSEQTADLMLVEGFR